MRYQGFFNESAQHFVFSKYRPAGQTCKFVGKFRLAAAVVPPGSSTGKPQHSANTRQRYDSCNPPDPVGLHQKYCRNLRQPLSPSSMPPLLSHRGQR